MISSGQKWGSSSTSLLEDLLISPGTLYVISALSKVWVNNAVEATSSRLRVQEPAQCESRGGRPGLSVLMSLTVSVDVKQHRTILRPWSYFVPNMSWAFCPNELYGVSVWTDVKQHWTMSRFVPNMSTDIREHEALHHHHHSLPLSVSLSLCLSVSVSVHGGAVWNSRWPSWAFRPNEPYGFCGRKATLNHASALVTVCPWYFSPTSEDLWSSGFTTSSRLALPATRLSSRRNMRGVRPGWISDSVSTDSNSSVLFWYMIWDVC